MIWDNIDDFVSYLNDRRLNDDMPLAVVATCGGFDPVHVGHVRCFKESSAFKYDFPNGIFVIIANGDGFLETKKGFVFMPEDERIEILSSFSGVDHVVKWYDGTQNCIGAIEKIKPNIFTKGGDRSSRKEIPEADICDKISCKIKYGVGGNDKVQSSSWLTKNQANNLN
jgi:glycerol-3-phosphate cytidylyltransferase-like family protein